MSRIQPLHYHQAGDNPEQAPGELVCGQALGPPGPGGLRGLRLPWGKRHALIVVLGYSRRMWHRFYERQTMPVVMRGLERSFAYCGGVPSELMLFALTLAVPASAHAGDDGLQARSTIRCPSETTDEFSGSP